MMNRYVVFCLFVFISFNLDAASGGIEESNYSLSVDASDDDYSNSKSLSGLARVPISNYLGLAIAAEYSDTNGKGYFDNLDHSRKSVALRVIFRDFNWGEIDASYGHATYDLEGEYIADDLNLKSASIGGSLYLGDFDIRLERMRTDYDGDYDERANASSLGLHYYINDRLRVGATFGAMDIDDSNQASITYQPKILGDAAALSFTFIDDDYYPTRFLSLTYFLNQRVTLKDRIRRY